MCSHVTAYSPFKLANPLSWVVYNQERACFVTSMATLPGSPKRQSVVGIGCQDKIAATTTTTTGTTTPTTTPTTSVQSTPSLSRRFTRAAFDVNEDDQTVCTKCHEHIVRYVVRAQRECLYRLHHSCYCESAMPYCKGCMMVFR